jgi:hypothetical protein
MGSPSFNLVHYARHPQNTCYSRGVAEQNCRGRLAFVKFVKRKLIMAVGGKELGT